ncbi:efflux RND transporter periplasmic adaptor subunit [Derxia gummosa]|uniref:Efflux RND transporter periplasmic adaptor subunit n=1 Tax=Derxia gummosa DSM 723 TaxID=1121388 RepID=A0A8B6X9I0_9BURK|nr:HlyD family efflux transporter periplasmic adaptor subunit [Derxia gummosa]
MPYDHGHPPPDTAATLALLDATAAAQTAAERRFLLLDRSREAWPYQIAVLVTDGRIAGHSGAGEVDAQGPYAQWLGRLACELRGRPGGALSPADIADAALAAEWAEWWPDHLLWLPAAEGLASDAHAADASPAPHDAQAPAANGQASGLLLVRDLPWMADEADSLGRWFGLWRALDSGRRAEARVASAGGWRGFVNVMRHQPAARRRRIGWALAALIGVLCLPVHLTVRAPGEIVPRDPVVLRAALDGTVRELKVEPNQFVQAGQVLAELDDAGWSSRLQVAQQALLTAETEWRQTSQQALNDPRAKAQLAAAIGKVEEKRADVAFLGQQVRRTALVAPHDGVVLIQDAGGWPGRTVSAGEAVMKLARPGDQEVEAWLAAGDAIDLPDGTPMHLHLASRPGSPVEAKLRLYAFEAEHRPDAGLGYRLRGTLDGDATERLGARGTVRIDGPRVPLGYWVLRRPLAALRETTGW